MSLGSPPTLLITHALWGRGPVGHGRPPGEGDPSEGYMGQPPSAEGHRDESRVSPRKKKFCSGLRVSPGYILLPHGLRGSPSLEIRVSRERNVLLAAAWPFSELSGHAVGGAS